MCNPWAQIIARLRRQLKEEQQAHGAARAAFVAEVVARDALQQLLRSCEACLLRRLAAAGGCTGPGQPAAEPSAAGSCWRQDAHSATGATGSTATHGQCMCSGGGVAHLQPGRSPPTATGEALTLHCMPTKSMNPRSTDLWVGTPRRHRVPLRQSRSAHDILQLSPLLPPPPCETCSSQHPLSWPPTEAVDAAAALAAMCGVNHHAQDQDAADGCVTAACAARLDVVRWLAEHAFGAGRVTALHACRQAVVDELADSSHPCSPSQDIE
jgi:hypothetical protein